MTVYCRETIINRDHTILENRDHVNKLNKFIFNFPYNPAYFKRDLHFYLTSGDLPGVLVLSNSGYPGYYQSNGNYIRAYIWGSRMVFRKRKKVILMCNNNIEVSKICRTSPPKSIFILNRYFLLLETEYNLNQFFQIFSSWVTLMRIVRFLFFKAIRWHSLY